MGITNRAGAMYMATGIDNTGLYKGKREAMGLIKAMAGEVTSFDVFGGIGVSAAVAFAKAAKDAYTFEKDFQKSMYEVASISGTIKGSLTDYMNSLIEMTRQVPVAANDSAKALYQIVSAGHDGANAMEILEVSAKAAVGGVTETATAADAITTVLNAYKMSASEAGKVSDMLFTTAKLGKTTMGELGQTIAQAAPIAASYGVGIDQVLAAVASLTKQGTPTAQAMTQIRASILGVSKVLGDGAFDGRTYQDALAEVAKRANGSESELRKLVPEIEAVNAVLGMTGNNANAAASDLGQLQNSLGASEAAFKTMQESADNQLQLLQNNITATLRPLGEGILKEVAGVAQKMNDAFSNGDMENSLQAMETLIKLVSVAFVGYKVATLDVLKTTNAEAAVTKMMATIKASYHKVIGDGIIQKETERLSQEAYIASLESSITAEQRAALEKQNLKKGSKEYADALSDIAVNAKNSADQEVESLTKSLEKNRDKLASAKERVEMSKEVTEAAKKELDAALEANDISATEAAQSKVISAAKREESATNDMNTVSRKINNQEKRLGIAQTRADSASTVLNSATTAGNSAAATVSSRAHNFLAAAKLKATIATRTLTAAMAANPIGALLTVVSLAASAWLMFSGNTEKAKTKLQEFREEQDKLKESTNNLLNTLYDTNEADRIRIEALDKLKEMYPDVWKGVTLENLALKDRNKTLKETNTLRDKEAENRLYSLMLASKERLENLKLNHDKKIASPVQSPVPNSVRAEYTVDNTKDIEEEENLLRDLEKQYYATQTSKQKLIEERLPVDARISIYEKELKDLQAQIEKATGAKKEFSLTDWGDSPKLPTFEDMPKFSDQFSLQLLENQARQTKEKLEAAKKSKETGKKSGTGTSLTEDQKREAEKRKSTMEDIAKTVLGVELKLQQDRVALMVDGREKALAEIEVDRKARLQAIDESENELKKKYASTGRVMPKNVTNDYTQQRETANTDAGYKTEAVNKEYDQKEVDFQKELSSVFLTEEEKRKQVTQDRYDAMRKAQQESYEAELRNIDLTKTGKEAQDAKTDAVIKYNEASTGINKAQTFDEAKDNKEKLDSLISQLNDFKGKEYTLNKDWDKRIADAAATGDADLLERMKAGKQKALSELNAQMLMQSSEWIRLFGNMDTLTVNELDNLITSIQGKIDEGSLNLNPVDLQVLMEKLGTAKDKIAQKNPFKALSSAMKETKKAIGDLKKAEEAGLTGDALDKYKDEVSQAADRAKIAIVAIGEAYGELRDVMKSAAELISMVDEGLGETVNNAIAMADAVMNIGEVVANAVIGFAKGMSTMETASVILLIIKAVIMAVMAAISLFNGDKKHEKKIVALQENVDALKKAYDRLGEAIEGAFSSNKAALIDKESENLRQQNDLIAQQINEENDKKKTDHDKVKEWQNEIDDNNRRIEENTKKRKVEAIMGTEIMQAIDDFAQAYAAAWASGEKAAGKSAAVVKNLIKTAIIDMLKNKLQPEVTAFMTFLSEAMADGIIDSVEQQKINDWEKKLEGIADETLKGKEKWLEDEESKKKDGVTGQLKAEMTEGTASELVGLWNMTALDIRALKDLTAEHFRQAKPYMLNVESILAETRQINANTKRGADNTDGLIEELREGFFSMNGRLKSIEDNTKNSKSRG